MTFCTNCGQKLPDDAKFCSSCGKAVEVNSGNRKKVIYDGDVHQCPQCGEILDSFVTHCPSCRFEIRGIQNSTAVRDFASKIEEIENARFTQAKGIVNKLGKKDRNKELDQQKIAIIRGFLIPNTKEDMLEFLILASANINANAYNAFGGISMEEKNVIDAWVSKFEQAYDKARLSFSSSREFAKIKEIYDNKMVEIKKCKMKGRLGWCALIAFYVFLFGLACGWFR